MSNSFRFLNEHKQKWRLNVGDTVKKCPKSWEWPCRVTLAGPRATGFMKLHPHGLKNRFPVKFPIPKMPSMFFQQYTICYTMLYYITVILIHYIYLYINIFYIYICILYVSLSIYFNISLFECLLKPCPNSGDPGPLLVSSQQSTSLSNDGKPNHQPRSTQGDQIIAPKWCNWSNAFLKIPFSDQLLVVFYHH